MKSPLTVAHSLPRKPGVYLFHDQAGVVIYVGKAIDLRSRVSSYFRPKTDLSLAKLQMVERVERIEHIIVRSETEALLLESTLIKKYRPKYNVLLKDDKFFQYIKIRLRERFPLVETVRKVTIDGSRYFGPYTSGLAVRQTMRLLKRLFPYKSCTNDPEHPCFDAQLGRCLGHDIGPESAERYRQVIGKLIDFLEGKTGSILTDLRRNMKRAAARRDFENAALYRDRLQALSHVIEQQTVITPRRDSFDVIGVARSHDVAAVNLFQVRQGKLAQRDSFMLQHVEDRTDTEVVAAFVEQYYSQSTVHPRQVFVRADVPTAVGNALQLRVVRAQRGVKRKLLVTAEENAADHLQRERERWMSDAAKAKLGLDELAHALHLDGPPRRVEMFDVSHFQGAHPVASMVVFEDGQPKKSDYRKFVLRDLDIPDDQHRLAEVVRRRFAHHGDERWPHPDLLILDGGKSQLSVVSKNVPGLAQHVRLAALAKEHEEVFVPGRTSPIRLTDGSQELFLIQRIRDEAHRFAIGFYRRKHRRETTRSILDAIPGLGTKQRQRLLRTFGTVDAIRAAADERLVSVVGQRLTRVLREHL